MQNTLTHNAAPTAASSRMAWRRQAAGLGCALAFAGLSAVPAVASAADAPQCELDPPIRFGGMNWETNLVLVELERDIAGKGYGCESEVLRRGTLPAL